jgi:hypothetical protein
MRVIYTSKGVMKMLRCPLSIKKYGKVVKTSDQSVNNHKTYFHIVLFCINNGQCSKREAVWLPFNDHIYNETVQELKALTP